MGILSYEEWWVGEDHTSLLILIYCFRFVSFYYIHMSLISNHSTFTHTTQISPAHFRNQRLFLLLLQQQSQNPQPPPRQTPP